MPKKHLDAALINDIFYFKQDASTNDFTDNNS